MGVAENKNLIESFFHAGDRGDLDTCLDLLDDHIKWTSIGSTKYSGTFVGKRALLDDLLGPVFGKLRAGISSTVENVVAEHDFVVVQSRGHAETVDGRRYDNTYCHVFKIRDGKISEVTEYMDTELVSAVLGQ